MSGAIAWSAFGIIEHSFVRASWLQVPDISRPAAHWLAGTTVVSTYAVLGGLAAAVLAALSAAVSNRSAATHTVSAAGVVALVLAVQWHLVSEFGRAGLIAAAAAAALTAAAIFGRGTPASLCRSPWLAAGLLLGAGQVLGAWPIRSGEDWRLCGGIVVAAGVFIAGRLALDRAWKRCPRRTKIFAGLSGRAAFCAASMLVVLATPAGIYTTRVSAAAPTSPLPNIVIVVMDTVRADHMSLYGYERRTTPVLERLASEASTFTNAYAAGHMSLTSHASLFTGLYPATHGAFPPTTALPGKFETLAEMAAAAGYRTVGVVANQAYLHPRMGLAQGFAYWDHRGPALLLPNAPRFTLRNRIVRTLKSMAGLPLRARYLRTAEEVTDSVVGQIRTLTSGRRPFLLVVNYMDAHEPYTPPRPFDTRFGGKDPKFDWLAFKHWWHKERGDKRMPMRAEKHLFSQYDGAIAYVDEQIGRVLDELHRVRAYDRTLIVVTSDHGEFFGEHDKLGHEVGVFQEIAHIPLVIKWPRVREKRVVTSAVTTVDVLPTVLEAMRKPVPGGLPGRPLNEQIPPDRAVLVDAIMLRDDERINARALIAGHLKLVVRRDGKQELYDIAKDPQEQTNLAARQPELVAGLREQLDSWIEEQGGGELPGDPPPVDAETLERLRALGYLQ